MARVATLIGIATWPHSTCCGGSNLRILGSLPDGDRPLHTGTPESPMAHGVDAAGVAVDWALDRAMRTAHFWCMAGGYFCGMFAWYAGQIH